GGNGAAWDWSVARALAPRPFALAGGLSPDNLPAAAAASGACFFDLSSSIESAPGRKDRSRVLAAITAARSLAGDPAFLA
ncbi:MAG: N-(5'-phosphoribosyl)anthranilate isomerase, partial [Kiritimatiellae bacterium]|nr:N-(5'-phosphoribosyl)anthranilate isomerase [Kiritimatiellia bacterium]